MSRLIALRFDCTPTQTKILRTPARRKVLVAGRRFGKTSYLGYEQAVNGIERPGKYWYIGRSYLRATDQYKMLLSSAGLRSIVKRKSEDPIPHIELINGTTFYYASFDKPDYLRGGKAAGVQVDEAPYMSYDAIQSVLRPMTADLRGWITYAGTPRGIDWFWELYEKGKAGLEPGLVSWKFTTYDGPCFQTPEGREEIEQARREMPDVIFRQEFLAEATANAAAVFRYGDIQKATQRGAELRPDSRDRQSGEYLPCVLAYDIGKVQDPPGLVVMDAAGRVLRAEELPRGMEYAAQARYLAKVKAQYNAVVVVDVTGGGAGGREQGAVDTFYKYVPDLSPCSWNTRTKDKYVELLSVALQEGEIAIPAAAVELVRQLQNYEFKHRAGYFVYSAPDGQHDDIVGALLMANWARVRGFIPVAARRGAGFF